MSKDTRFYRYLALGSYLGLLAWVSIWQFVLEQDSLYSPMFRFALYILPLLLPLKGMLQGKPYTHAWANFVVLFYIIGSLTVIYSHPEVRIYGIVELVLATGMFTGCCVYARKRGRELGLGLKKLKTVMQEEKERFEGGE